ncbi:cilium assembly protein DZIP1 isoform X2 [Sardina pilchardus]|uniref:cilium assembly protein DZIP1 isoform X2 n=1 Tax=Sardina pilchardus TaxID=27697 RepID=UPI002E14332C
MPFFNNIYYPYQVDGQGAQTSVGIPSLLSSPQSHQSGHSQHTGSVGTMSTQASASSASSAAVPLPPFRFRTRRESVDWRRLGALDVERVASELDFQTLQEHIAGVTFCSVEAERCQRCQAPVDGALLKLFRLSQLTVEYLLHSQDYLSAALQAAEERAQAERGEKEQAHLALRNSADELKALKEELKQRKKIIASQQAMISTGLTGYFKCHHCDKAFMNATFLQGHMQRRHLEDYDIKLLTDGQKKVQCVRLQEEMERLKEQLSLTRSQLDTQQQAGVAKATQERDLNERQEELIRDLEEWKADERRTMERRIEEIRQHCQRDVDTLYHKNTLLEQQLAKVQETNRELVSRAQEGTQGTTQRETKRRTTRPDAHEDTHAPGERGKHQQEIVTLEQKLQAQEEKWTDRLLKIQKEHETAKNQLNGDMRRLQKSLAEQSRRPAERLDNQPLRQGKELRHQAPQVTERVANQPLRQGKELRHQAPQVKKVSANPPTIVVKHEVTDPAPKVQPAMHDSSSISEKKTISLEVQERVKEFLKNPAAKREMREIVEQTLGDELHSLGITSETRGLSQGEYNRLTMEVRQKRSCLVVDGPRHQRVRAELSLRLDQRVQDRLAGCSSAPEKQRRTRDAPVALPRTMSSSLWSQGSRTISDAPAKQLQTPKASSISRTKAQPSTSTPKAHQVSSDDESEEGLVPPSSKRSSCVGSQPVAVPRALAPQVLVCRERSSAAVERDGGWTEGSDLEEISTQQQNSSPMSRRTPGHKALGHHVKDLTRNLENQLADQGPAKLAGSINTINTANYFGTHNSMKSIPKSKEVVQELKNGKGDDDDDDDDWDISSLDDVSKPNSSLTLVQKTLDSSSTSVWGPSPGLSPKPGLTEAGTGSTLKSSLVSVSDWSSSEDE